MKLKNIFLLIIAPLITFISCNPTEPEPAVYEYRVPTETNDGWQTASLDEVGLNKTILSRMIQDIYDKKYDNIHSILIVKDDKLVLEEYFRGYKYDWEGEEFRGNHVNFSMNTWHNIHSVTKSITSALLGIAIDKGFIQSVDEKVFSFFPEYSHLSNTQKDKITIKHFLTMSSGLGWNENDVPPGDMNNDVVQLFIVNDPIEYVLAKPVVSEPGTAFYYHSGGVNVLGELIKKATGLRLDVFCDQSLFSQLGITNYRWNFINPNIVFCSGDLELLPRDIAKFGYLFLNDGKWNVTQIISQEWIETSFLKHYSFQDPNWIGYGYLWWLRADNISTTSIDSFHAYGWGGQRSIVFPDLNMVVVFTGGNYVTDEPVDEIIVQYLLPAVE